MLDVFYSIDFYAFIVVVGALGIFLSRKSHWFWGIAFLIIVGGMAADSWHMAKLEEKYFHEELMRVLQDGVIDPDTEMNETYDDDAWAFENQEEEGVRYEIVLQMPEVREL